MIQFPYLFAFSPPGPCAAALWGDPTPTLLSAPSWLFPSSVSWPRVLSSPPPPRPALAVCTGQPTPASLRVQGRRALLEATPEAGSNGARPSKAASLPCYGPRTPRKSWGPSPSHLCLGKGTGQGPTAPTLRRRRLRPRRNGSRPPAGSAWRGLGYLPPFPLLGPLS